MNKRTSKQPSVVKQVAEKTGAASQVRAQFAHYEEGIPMSNAAKDVLAERQRQISAEGWTSEHDDDYSFGELARAGAAYAAQSIAADDAELECGPPPWWPWSKDWWKPASRRRMLVKAGALILADIERLDRAALQTAPPQAGAGKDGAE